MSQTVSVTADGVRHNKAQAGDGPERQRRQRIKRSLSFIGRHRRLIITTAVLILLVTVVAPQTDALWRGLEIVRQASPLLVLTALFMTVMTYAISAEIYHMLLKHPIRLRRLFLVQVAAALTSRVAPIGVGTMGLNAIFLRKQRHSLPQSLAVVATNNVIGVGGHLLLLAIIATTSPFPADPGIHLSWSVVYWVLLIMALVAVILAVSERLRRRIVKGTSNLLHDIAGYRHKPRTLVTVLLASMLLSAVYVLALMACCQALDILLPFNQIFLIYTFSLLTGVATPIPGGLVGVEAGLVTGLVAYGTAADTALAVALLYRLVTYWLPLLPGFIAFRILQRRYF